MSQPEEIFGTEAEIKRESAHRTRRSFVVGGVAAAAAYGLWRAVDSGEVIGHQPITFRRTFQADAAISRAVFDERGLSPTYPLARATELRLNGTAGLEQMLEPASWRLQLVGVADAERSPRYVRDVTAWEYEYGDDVQPDQQSNDVKSAPGNGDTSKTGAAKAPDPQKNKSAGGDQPSAKPAQEPGAGAGSGQPAADAANATDAHNLDKNTPKVNGLPHVTIAERFDAMNRALTHKRNIGDDEAGPSASSLDIGTPGLLLAMEDLMQLPQVELVTQFKCIEGWSQIVRWSGVRLRDLIEAYPPAKVNGADPAYVYMETPDGNYYGGYDMTAARHPQSLLVTHMSGQPLTQSHGAPLRLHMPIKYGYKQLKRIGLIAYTRTRPDDYWTKLGYDWYAGL